jgi:hypothetical protein
MFDIYNEEDSLKFLCNVNGLIKSLNEIIMDYWWRFPKTWTYNTSNVSINDYQIIEGVALMREDTYQLVEEVDEDWIGRVGHTNDMCIGYDGPQFVIVWIHPSKHLFGVLYIKYDEGTGEIVYDDDTCTILCTISFVIQRTGGLAHAIYVQEGFNRGGYWGRPGNVISQDGNGRFLIDHRIWA